MEKEFPGFSVTIAGILLLLASHTQAAHIVTTDENEFLTITRNGEYTSEEYIDDLKESHYIELTDYYYFWQGEDSIDYCIKGNRLKLNGKIIGVDLREMQTSDILHPELILTAKIEDINMVELLKLPRLEILNIENQLSDHDMLEISKLKGLRLLNLSNTDISDIGLAHLKEMTNLKVLLLQDTKVSDSGLVHLKGMKSLQELHLGYTNITDKGLVYFKRLTNLRNLNLSHTNITDSGLAKLKNLKNLRKVDLSQVF